MKLSANHWWQSFWIFWASCFTVERSKFSIIAWVTASVCRPRGGSEPAKSATTSDCIFLHTFVALIGCRCKLYTRLSLCKKGSNILLHWNTNIYGSWNSHPRLTTVPLHVSSVLLSVSISHNFWNLKSVISLLYALFAFVSFLFFTVRLQRSAVRTCYMPSCPVHLSIHWL